jgi:FixJ family two-component response regulator
MPQMSGKQLAEVLCAERPGLRTLYMSGYTADLLAGADVPDHSFDLLHKPFNRSELLCRVRSALERQSSPATSSLSNCST